MTQEQWERDAKRYESAFNGDSSLALQMGVFTASLGVGCSFCHDPENWGSDANPKKTVGRPHARYGRWPQQALRRRQEPGDRVHGLSSGEGEAGAVRGTGCGF